MDRCSGNYSAFYSPFAHQAYSELVAAEVDASEAARRKSCLAKTIGLRWLVVQRRLDFLVLHDNVLREEAREGGLTGA